MNVWQTSANRVAIVEINVDVFDDRPALTRERIISLTCSIDWQSFNCVRRSSKLSKQALRTFKFSSLDKMINKGKIKWIVFVDLNTHFKDDVHSNQIQSYSNDWPRLSRFWQASARISAFVSLMKFLKTGNKRLSTLEIFQVSMTVFELVFVTHTFENVIEMLISIGQSLIDLEHMNHATFDWGLNPTTRKVNEFLSLLHLKIFG